MRRCLVISASLYLASVLHGEIITGSITIKRKLTKRSVTAAVSIYQRGPDVELTRDPEEDPLTFERSRVAVWIDGPGPTTRDQASMQQAGRRFSPDFIVVPVGATVSFPNMDPIFHNVFSLSRPQMFDLGNYPKGDTRNVAFPKPGIVYVNCHLHPNMAGVIVVTPNRWNAKADGAGQFELHDVPPGEYTVVAWHKAAGYFRQTVRVVHGSETKIEFFIPLGELKPEKALVEK
jgi:plastocyanin